MNGIEMNDKLDKLEAKFGEWYNRSIYEINWEVIHHFASLQGDTACLQCLKELKNSVYKRNIRQKKVTVWETLISRKSVTCLIKLAVRNTFRTFIKQIKK